MSFIKLFEPARVGNLVLRNRIVMPPMTTSYACDGFVTDTMIDYYAARAKGGVGLVIVEDCIVETPVGIHGCNDIFIDDDKFIPDLRRLAKAIKQHGARAAIQLNHSGRMGGRLRDGRLVLTNGVQPVAPSPIAYPAKDFVVPKELTITEIEAVEDKFAAAAFRAREAGFDMVSVHCSHQFLAEQFLSPLSNTRTDAYGGSPEKRFRFIREIIEKIRQTTGNDFTVICRVSGKEVMPGGLTINDACGIALKLEQVGINALNVSHGANPAGVTPRTAAPLTERTAKESRGGMDPLAAAIKKSVKIPVMTVGRIIMPQMAEDILQQGRADFICIGKGLIADPDWAVKVQEGREAEIRHCIACDYCFTSVEGASLACAVNPACGRERAFKLVPSPESKKVFIAGGGPAGLEAARVAAERGHKVVLYEKNQPGGQLNMASRLPGKDEYPLFLDYELVQLNRLGVKIVRQELRRDAIESEKPEVVIIATGALPRRPALPGIEKENVLTAWQVFEGASARGKKVVVIGGSATGAEAAEVLAMDGSHVTIIEKSGEIAPDVAYSPFYHAGLLRTLDILGVKALTGTSAVAIAGNGVKVSANGKSSIIKADVIVIALGMEPDRSLADEMEGMGVKFYTVGDCAGNGGGIAKAVKEGAHVGMAI